MPWRLRSSMTMSRKSMLSSWSWSRRRTSGFTLERSSSGAMSAMMSSTTCLHSSLVIWKSSGQSGDKPADNQRGIYAEHPEGVVQDGVHLGDLTRLVEHEAGQRALRVEVVHVDGRVDGEVVKRRQVARQLERAGRAHAVADE